MMKSQSRILCHLHSSHRQTMLSTHLLLIQSLLGLSLILASSNIYAQTTTGQNNQKVQASPRVVLKESAAERQAKADASKRVNRISDQLKSPFCPGKTLLTCTSPQAYELRKEMSQMIIDGRSDDEILAALRDSFGEKLENPPQPWYTVLVPILPFVFGALIAAWVFSSWLRGSRLSTESEENEPASKELSKADEERLRELMKEVD